jgi:NarL family two-component system response regulator LiaR
MKKKAGKAIRVLIVDDHAIVREGLRAFLGMLPDIELTGEAGGGEEALAAVARGKPEIVLMDLVMPGMDGIEATRRLAAEHPEVKVIALTSFSDDEKLYPVIKAGAVAYLLKDVGPQELAETIRAAARGEVRLAPEVTRRLMSGIAGETPAGEPLTERERQVLACLGRGLANKGIAAELFISEKTVKTHVSNLLGKLRLADRTQAALYAVKHGLWRGPLSRGGASWQVNPSLQLQDVAFRVGQIHESDGPGPGHRHGGEGTHLTAPRGQDRLPGGGHVLHGEGGVPVARAIHSPVGIPPLGEVLEDLQGRPAFPASGQTQVQAADARAGQSRGPLQPRAVQVPLRRHGPAAEHALVERRQLPPVPGHEVHVDEAGLHRNYSLRVSTM